MSHSFLFELWEYKSNWPSVKWIKGLFIIYARGWAGKNEGWATSNSAGQSEEGGGLSSINLHTKRGEGYPIFYLCFSFKQILSELSGLTYMVCKPPKGEQFITGSLKLIKKTVTISTKWYVPIVRQEVFLVSFDPWGVPTTAMINNKVKLAVTSFDRIIRQYFLLLPTDVCVDF